MKKIKFFPIILLVCLLTALLAVPAAALTEPETGAAAVLVLDRPTGEVLYEKNADTQSNPASTTKIMTVLLAVEAIERGEAALTDEVTASTTAFEGLSADGSTAGIRSGETMTLEQLLYCTMLSSANEACNIIAEHLSGSVSAFVARMNERAAELGCTGTHYANTHGLTDSNHYTTARDMGLIALEASNHPLFMTLCGTAEYTVPATNLAGARALTNSNALLTEKSMYGAGFLYDGASGMKTGHTSAAGYCLVSTAEREDRQLLCVVYGDATSSACFTDSKTLLDWALDNYSYQNVLRSDENIASVDVSLGTDTDYVNLRPAGDVTMLLANDYDPNDFTLDIVVYALRDGKVLTAPITAGEVLGEVSVMRDGRSCGTVKLLAASSVELSRWEYIKSELHRTTQTTAFKLILFGVILLVVVYVVWVVLYRSRRRKYTRAVRAGAGRHVAAPQRPAAPEPEEAPIEFFTDDYAAEPEPPAAPEQPEPPVHEAQETDSLFADKADRDYFEEFFKGK